MFGEMIGPNDMLGNGCNIMAQIQSGFFGTFISIKQLSARLKSQQIVKSAILSHTENVGSLPINNQLPHILAAPELPLSSANLINHSTNMSSSPTTSWTAG